MGSLVTAVASYLDVKKRGGSWFVRIDDIDPPRQKPEFTRLITDCLNRHALLCDGPIDYQSKHYRHYYAALTSLRDSLFYCRCSRRALRETAFYPGTCRDHSEPRSDAAIRIRVTNTPLRFEDEICGKMQYNLAKQGGDFIVRRRDGLISYALATAIDDGAANVSHVLRGHDLIDTTAPQLYLMHKLGLNPPQYAHIPLLTYADGTKLSKQTHAPPLNSESASKNLREAFFYLGLNPPTALEQTPQEWLAWGLERWRIEAIPSVLPTFRQRD